MSIKKFLIEKFNNKEIENVGAKRIFESFEAKSNFEKDIIRKALDELLEEGFIVYQNGRFTTLENSNFKKGVLRGNERGFAFLLCDSGDLFIPYKNLNGALNGDTVIAKPVLSKRGSTDEGEVYKILTRGVKKLVGTFQGENGFGFVIPDDKNYFVDVYVPFKFSRGAKTGDKVLIEIISYPENRKNPEGKVLEIIGKKYDLRAEELSIIKNANLPFEFSKEVLKESEKIPSFVSESELVDRVDFRNQGVITIDGDDSKDFDDAVFVEENKDKTFTLYVHIADVSHYVKRGSFIDKEAFNRSMSAYFPERVIPMLPEKLSNGICSLNENVDRLTLSVIMKINKKGEIIDSQIKEGVINSKRRMTYSNVQKIIDGDTQTIEKYQDIYKMILLMSKLKDVLVQKREKKGNIDLSVKESHITVENGKIKIEPRKSIDAYKIIEEFMIATNETVAEFVFYMGLPFIYRVHEKPDSEKLETFKAFLNNLGILVRWNEENVYSKDFQSLLKNIEGEIYYNVVNKVMLRSMQKAKYCQTNLGHFGLSSSCYSHFTSPIRRYPDLIIHSIIKDILKGKEVEEKYKNLVVEVSNHTSTIEKKVDEVEREMDDYYKCRYMRSEIGKEFSGVISGVTNFGVFVELENTVEGLVKLEMLPRGNYVYDEKRFKLYSNKREFNLGDEVVVKVLGVDTSAKRVEFMIIS